MSFSRDKKYIEVFKTKNLKTFNGWKQSWVWKNNSPQREKNNCKPVGSYGLSKYNASKFVMKLGRTKSTLYHFKTLSSFGPNQKINRLIPQLFFHV